MTGLHRSRALADTAAEKLRVFAQAQRLMILSYIADGERRVAEIEQATGIEQPALSQQLAELRRADLVKTRRDAKLVHYRLADDGVALCVRTLEAMFGDDKRTATLIQGAVSPVEPAVSRPAIGGAATFAVIGERQR